VIVGLVILPTSQNGRFCIDIGDRRWCPISVIVIDATIASLFRSSMMRLVATFAAIADIVDLRTSSSIVLGINPSSRIRSSMLDLVFILDEVMHGNIEETDFFNLTFFVRVPIKTISEG
jgi:hypothetical protein